MNGDHIIVREMDNGWLASYHTNSRPYIASDLFAETAEEALEGALAALDKARKDYAAY